MRGKSAQGNRMKLFLDVSYDILNGAKELGENLNYRFFDLVKKSTFGRFWMTTSHVSYRKIKNQSIFKNISTED